MHHAIDIAGVSFSSPVILASGTCGYGAELEGLLPFEAIGGIATKGISLLPREGNAPPRIAETTAGMLNAIGLANVGLDAFVRDKLPYLRDLPTRTVVNIFGETMAEYVTLADALSHEDGVDALELNVSCPNVDHGGIELGTEPGLLLELVAAVKQVSRVPVWVKLTPNVTDIAPIAGAARAGGADALVAINTLRGMAIDLEAMTPVLARRFGGLSGPAIKPIALAMAWKALEAVDIPVIGCGGITTAIDALEFVAIGCHAVQVGTATFVDPRAGATIAQGIPRWLADHHTTLDEVRGRAHTASGINRPGARRS